MRPTMIASLFAVAGLAAVAAADPVLVGANADLAQGLLTSPVGIVSARAFNGSGMSIAPGDTYGAILIGQSVTQAAFYTAAGRVNTFTYDLTASQHGTGLAGASIMVTESQSSSGPGNLRVVIACFTADSSALWPAANIGVNPAIQGRFDVGAGATTNGLLWDNIPGAITSVTITNAVLADGAVLATSNALINGRVLPEMGAQVVWNGVIGSIVDETQMIFDINFQVPTPGAATLAGLGGLMAFRRRR